MPRGPEEEASPEQLHCRAFHWLSVVFWWEGRRCWLQSLLAAYSGIQLPQIPSAVSLSCHFFIRVYLSEKGTSQGDAHLTLACQKAQPFEVSAPFLYVTNGMFKDNRCGVKILSWENPMFHSIEGLL